ncbi:Transcription elongation factor spt6 [Metarhizium acridum]|nr:Transcription elongation factor spt6 [Metarhizium acridum]
MVEEMIPEATTMEELQDLQDYLQFQYGAKLRDLAVMAGNHSQSKRPAWFKVIST